MGRSAANSSCSMWKPSSHPPSRRAMWSSWTTLAATRTRLRAAPSEPGAPIYSSCRHVGLDPGFIDKHEPSRGDPALIGLPARALAGHIRSYLLLGQQGFFEAQALGVNEHPHGP